MHNRRKWRSRAAKKRATYHGRFVKVKRWERVRDKRAVGHWAHDVFDLTIRAYKQQHREQFGLSESDPIGFDDTPDASGGPFFNTMSGNQYFGTSAGHTND